MNKLTVTRGEVGGDNGGKMGKGFQEYLQRTHAENHRGVGSRLVNGDDWSEGNGWGKMETIVLEHQ